MEWHFTDITDCDFRALYLCWRAAGEDRWDSWYLALNRLPPANWTVTQEA